MLYIRMWAFISAIIRDDFRVCFVVLTVSHFGDPVAVATYIGEICLAFVCKKNS